MRYVFTFLLCIQFCYSQTACFDTLFDGYNISSVTDDHQFIWVGTYNDGMISYNKDTSEILFYNTSNSAISSNSIQSVLKSNNRLYISTDNSLMAFSNNSFQEISTTIQGIMAVAPNGNLAVAAPYEFNILDLDNQITYTKDLLTLVTPSCCGKTTDIEYDSTGRLWLSNYAFYEFDILTYGNGIWEVYDINNSILPIESFYDYNRLAVNESTVMVTNSGGNMHKYENNIWAFEHSVENPSILNEQENINGLMINAIEFDMNGVFWVGAGNYENTSFGKIAYKIENDWAFIDNNTEELPGVNLFEESQYDFDIMYAATNDGLLIIDTNCLELLSTEDFENESNMVTIFPNPTTGLLNINTNLNRSLSIRLINNIGQVLQSQTDFRNDSIDLSNYSAGVYTLILEFDNKTVLKKILKF
ncbi:T9SS type A sorting domain-containing protein [Psychroserpens sp.]|uniref:T9SS type A sorting domain-containing protein n=1 Tax=Psychroserpens sp. TaxID=2020870 RepID=UPI0038583E8F